MSALAWLIPCALVLGALGLIGFLWSLKSNQYDDLEGAAWRALDDQPARKAPAVGSANAEPPREFKNNHASMDAQWKRSQQS